MADDQELLFDPFGLPQGVPARQMWASFLEQLDCQMEEEGWDRPPRLYLVCNPVDTSSMLYSRNIDPEEVTGGLSSKGPVFSYVHSDLSQGHPVESLWGFTAPAWASAVILSCEAWAIPSAASNPDGVPPSMHPERVEQRLTVMVTRAGEVHRRLRSRGVSHPVVSDSESLHGAVSSSGLILDALHHVAGAPSPEGSRITVRDLFIETLLATTHSVHQEVLSQCGRAASTGVRLPSEASTFAYSLLGVAARMLWEFTDRGRAGLTSRQRRVVAALRAHGPAAAVEETARDVLTEMCSALETVPSMSWSEFFRRPHARALLDPVLWPCVSQDPHWASEEVLASTVERVAGVRHADERSVMAAIPADARGIVAPLIRALTSGGVPTGGPE